MATCIVCNAETESEYEEPDMAMSRSRLEKVMEEVVPEDSMICSTCQFDLEQIEMYYCLLNDLKMRYWQAAEARRNDGYEAPASQNVLAETVRYSTVDTEDISDGMKSETVFPVSMYSVTRSDEITPETMEISAPLGIEILDVRSLQEDWQQATEPPREDSIVESLVEEDQAGDGLDLGCWSDGSTDCQNESEEQQQGENLMHGASDMNGYKYNTGYYFGYDAYTGNINAEVLIDDSNFSRILPVGSTKSIGRKPGRPRKSKHGKHRKILLGDLTTTGTPQNTEFVYNSASQVSGRSRKKKAHFKASQRKPGVSQNNKPLHAVRGMAAGKRKAGRPRKNPVPKNPVERPRKKAKTARVGVVAVPASAGIVKTGGVGDEGGRSGFVDGKKLVISIKKLDLQQGKNDPSSVAQVKSSKLKSKKAHTQAKNHRTEETPITESPRPPNKNSSPDIDLTDDMPLSERLKKSKRSRLKRRRSYIGLRTCAHCGSKFSSDDKLISHSLIHNDTKPFKCPTCGKGFSTRYYQTIHSMIHTSDNSKKFVCKICGKALITNSYLKLHMERHAGNLQYHCSICDRACVSASAFKMHMLVHSDEKPHICNQCGKAYKQKYPLKVHMLTHTGERPFKCECGMDFKEKVGLKLHKKSQNHAKRLGIQP